MNYLIFLTTTNLPLTPLTLPHPTYQLAGQSTNQPSVVEDDDSFATARDSQSVQLLDAFASAFGGEAALANLSGQEEARNNLLRPHLESEYANIECSNLSRHMWSHCKENVFANNAEMFEWIRSKWKVEIIHKSSMVQTMKTAGTRKCQLCMQERVALFHAFHKNKTRTHNLMNSRTEMYGACTCKTRFLWLHAVGNEGADEAT